MTRAIRVDTLRNRLDATRELLAMVSAELEDLHVLAYERQTAASDVVVNGGTRDWALDTHGDPRARDAYRHLGDHSITACNLLAEAAHDAIRLLHDGDPHRPKTRRIIETEELAYALEAQGRRAGRGEYTPVRTQAQPEVKGVKRTVDRLLRERDEARRDVERLTRRLERYEPTQPMRRRRRRRRIA